MSRITFTRLRPLLPLLLTALPTNISQPSQCESLPRQIHTINVYAPSSPSTLTLLNNLKNKYPSKQITYTPLNPSTPEITPPPNNAVNVLYPEPRTPKIPSSCIISSSKSLTIPNFKSVTTLNQLPPVTIIVGLDGLHHLLSLLLQTETPLPVQKAITLLLPPQHTSNYTTSPSSSLTPFPGFLIEYLMKRVTKKLGRLNVKFEFIGNSHIRYLSFEDEKWDIWYSGSTSPESLNLVSCNDLYLSDNSLPPYSSYNFPLPVKKIRDGRIPINGRGESLEIPRTYIFGSAGYNVIKPSHTINDFDEPVKEGINDDCGYFLGQWSPGLDVMYGFDSKSLVYMYLFDSKIVGVGGFSCTDGGTTVMDVLGKNLKEGKTVLKGKYRVRFRKGRESSLIYDNVRLSSGITSSSSTCTPLKNNYIFLTQEDVNKKKCARDMVVSQFNYETAKGKVEYGKEIREYVESKIL